MPPAGSGMPQESRGTMSSKCTCHQCAGDTWDCPSHYRDSRRYRETRRIIELATNRVVTKQLVFQTLRKVDAENEERQSAFWAEMNADLDRRGL